MNSITSRKTGTDNGSKVWRQVYCYEGNTCEINMEETGEICGIGLIPLPPPQDLLDHAEGEVLFEEY